MVDARPWVVLGEDAPRELVVGAIGRFWGPGVEWLDIGRCDIVLETSIRGIYGASPDRRLGARPGG